MFDEVSGAVWLERWRSGLAARIEEEELAGRLGAPVDLSGVEAGLVAAAGVDPSVLGDDALLGAAAGLERCRRLLDAASVRVLGELDVRGTSDVDRGLRTGPWLADAAGLASGVVNRPGLLGGS